MSHADAADTVAVARPGRPGAGALIVPWPWRLAALAVSGVVVGSAAGLVRALLG